MQPRNSDSKVSLKNLLPWNAIQNLKSKLLLTTMKEVQHLKNNQDKQNQAMQALKSNINTFEKVNSTNCYKSKPKKKHKWKIKII